MAITTDEMKQSLGNISRAISKSQTRRDEQGKPPEKRTEFNIYNEAFPSDHERGCVSKLQGQAK